MKKRRTNKWERLLKTDMSLICLKKPVMFPGNKKVRIILPFASIDQSEHVDALGELVTLVEDYEFVELIEKTSSPKEIIDFIKSKK